MLRMVSAINVRYICKSAPIICINMLYTVSFVHCRSSPNTKDNSSVADMIALDHSSALANKK